MERPPLPLPAAMAMVQSTDLDELHPQLPVSSTGREELVGGDKESAETHVVMI